MNTKATGGREDASQNPGLRSADAAAYRRHFSTGCRICDGGTTAKVCDECRPTLVWANRRAAAQAAAMRRNHP